MIGKDFKAIRMANFITQEQFANKISKSVFRVRQVEKSDYIPVTYIKALSELLGVDLLNEGKLESVLKDIPERYKNRKPYFRYPALF